MLKRPSTESVIGQYSRVLEFFVRFLGVNVPTYALAKFPELDKLCAFTMAYFLFQIVGLCWGILLNAGFYLACRSTAILPKVSLSALSIPSINAEEFTSTTSAQLIALFYVSYASIRVVINFANSVLYLALESIQNFPNASKNFVSRGENTLGFTQFCFFPVLVLLVALISADSLCSHVLLGLEDPATLPSEVELGNENISDDKDELLVRTKDALCNHTGYYYLTSQFPQSRRLIFYSLLIMVLQIWQAYLQQFPNWNIAMSFLDGFKRVVFQTSALLLGMITLMVILAIFIIDIQEANVEELLGVVLLSWTLWLLLFSNVLISKCGATWYSKLSTQNMQYFASYIRMSQMAILASLFIIVCFREGFLQAQLDLTFITIICPTLHCIIYLLVLTYMKVSGPLIWIGLPVAILLSIFITMYIAKAEGNGSILLVCIHIMTKFIDFFGYDEGSGENDYVFGEYGESEAKAVSSSAAFSEQQMQRSSNIYKNLSTTVPVPSTVVAPSVPLKASAETIGLSITNNDDTLQEDKVRIDTDFEISGANDHDDDDGENDDDFVHIDGEGVMDENSRKLLMLRRRFRAQGSFDHTTRPPRTIENTQQNNMQSQNQSKPSSGPESNHSNTTDTTTTTTNILGIRKSQTLPEFLREEVLLSPHTVYESSDVDSHQKRDSQNNNSNTINAGLLQQLKEHNANTADKSTVSNTDHATNAPPSIDFSFTSPLRSPKAKYGLLNSPLPVDDSDYDFYKKRSRNVHRLRGYSSVTFLSDMDKPDSPEFGENTAKAARELLIGKGQEDSSLVSIGIPSKVKRHWLLRFSHKYFTFMTQMARNVSRSDTFTTGVMRAFVSLGVILVLILAAIAIASHTQQALQIFPQFLTFDYNKRNGIMHFDHRISNLTLVTNQTTYDNYYSEREDNEKMMNVSFSPHNTYDFRSKSSLSDLPQYSLCSWQWNSLTALDFAFLSQVAYFDDEGDGNLQHIVNALFPHLDFVVKASHKTLSSTGARYIEVTSKKLNTVIVAVRGTDIGKLHDLMEDFKLYAEPVIMSVLSHVFPTIRSWTHETSARVIEWLYEVNAFFGLIEEAEYYGPLTQRILELEHEGTTTIDTSNNEEKGEHCENKETEIFIVGHSLGGGLARIVGTLTGQPSISFSPPGMGLSYRKYSVRVNENNVIKISGKGKMHHRSIAVLPEYDWVPYVDEQVGLTQRILCDHEDKAMQNACHLLESQICHLLTHCGDPRHRFIQCSSNFDLSVVAPSIMSFIWNHKYITGPIITLFFLFLLMAILPELL